MEKDKETNRDKNFDEELGNMFQGLDNDDMDEIIGLMRIMIQDQTDRNPSGQAG